MSRTITISIDDEVFYYCGWYPVDGIRYPKYTRNEKVRLVFLNRACALNMNKTNDGFVLIENDKVFVIEEDIIVG